MAGKFDAIVIGESIAGLGVSALLGRAGLKTLCVEKDARSGGRMQSFDVEGGKVRWACSSRTWSPRESTGSTSREIRIAVGDLP